MPSTEKNGREGGREREKWEKEKTLPGGRREEGEREGAGEESKEEKFFYPVSFPSDLRDKRIETEYEVRGGRGKRG